MRIPVTVAFYLGIHVALLACTGVATASEPVRVVPASVSLTGRFAQQQLVVTGQAEGLSVDWTREASYRSETPSIVVVDESGVVKPVGDGTGTVVIESHGHTLQVAVTVSEIDRQLAVDFERDIQPIFTRTGCNSGACHGKARGQNGFQLSLLGFDTQFDYDALAKEARGRRVFLPVPEQSLLLQKPIGLVPHGGGRRIEAGSPEYSILLHWLQSGMPRSQPNTPQLDRISVSPDEVVMTTGAQQQLIVTAHYSDGSSRDVTRLAAFQSNESAIAAVDEQGLITAGIVTGEAAIMARYMGEITVCTVPVPVAGDVSADVYARLPRQNFIDDLVWEKLERLRITPSEKAPDHKFLRRAFLDIIGRTPTADEARRFLEDSQSDKRERLVDWLLTQPDFADHWANKWADLLRPNPYRVGLKAVMNFDTWIRNSFRKGQPYDEFVRELLTARGGTFRNGAVTLFRDRRAPDELTTITSQLFLGIRLECAKCHHHPFEVWGQDDFYSFAAYFARIGRKGTGLSPPISGSEEIVYTASKGSVKHPLTGEVLEPRPLFGTAPEVTAEEDPRESLAAWITSEDNPYFAQVMVNRVWADLMGLGLVEPVDDLRATNPASNAPLLEALGNRFRDDGFDLKKLIRVITTSYVYGLSSIPNERNVADTRNYSRHYRLRLRAEVLLDAISQITDVDESFDAMPSGSTAKQIWTHRVDSLFLDAFGRPDPNQDPPCERTSDTTIVQTLHLMNSENLFRKVTGNSSRVAKLAESDQTPEQIIEELYLLTYARYPDEEEIKIGRSLFETAETTRRQAAEDLLWALLNTPEFVFKD